MGPCIVFHESSCFVLINIPINSNLQTKTTARPKAVYYWTGPEVVKWFTRHCGEYSEQYAKLFELHDITGRALLRLSDDSLRRMGIEDDNDRDVILKEIMKQRLKRDIIEIKDLEHKNNVYENF